MIESISIADVATFGNVAEVLDGLAQFNYFFGSNGTGKTTVSRVIANEGDYSSCTIKWKGGTKLQTLVYNRDFVDREFNQCAEFKGVFTLGSNNIVTLNKISTIKSELNVLTGKIESLALSLDGENGIGGKRAELTALEEMLRDKCWAQKRKHDAKFKGAFEGVRNSAENFKAKVLQERSSNTAALDTLLNLEKKAETLFGPAPSLLSPLSSVSFQTLISSEESPILKKRVIGKEDVDIAAMIKKLGNSDWVKEGQKFYEANELICPFCQQTTTAAFADSLREYFDEAFETDMKEIDRLATSYQVESSQVQQQIEALISAASSLLDIEALKSEKALLDSRIAANLQRIAAKRKEPSQVAELESISAIAISIKGLIDKTNLLIADHNKMVANVSRERRTLTSQVWKYILEKELAADLSNYTVSRLALDKAISSMTEQIAAARVEQEKKSAEIRDLERHTTSVQPTIDGVNGILASFGFQGFSLSRSHNPACYKLVRRDGSDAKLTLSEGERSFVTFLYFYHLLKGSDSETGITTDRVVVFDDPVSSLDSDILFIVGTLIKGLLEEVRAGTGHIKQVFVLTHNVYFHREVTFSPRRRNVALTEESFWVVRKTGPHSKLEKHPTNPIKTSYELLWTEVRKPDRSCLTIQNTLRRILENYFKILGGVDLDHICGSFDGTEKMICRSLLSWVHAGSHYALDDIFVSGEESLTDIYLKVFRAIFEKTDQLAHFRMMMGDAYEESMHI